MRWFVSACDNTIRTCIPRALVKVHRGFSELPCTGGWRTTAAEYVAAVKRYDTEIGKLAWAAPQDLMVLLPRRPLSTCASIRLAQCLSANPSASEAAPVSNEGRIFTTWWLTHNPVGGCVYQLAISSVSGLSFCARAVGPVAPSCMTRRASVVRQMLSERSGQSCRARAARRTQRCHRRCARPSRN